jgi:hypothetical protein
LSYPWFWKLKDLSLIYNILEFDSLVLSSILIVLRFYGLLPLNCAWP